MLLLLLLCVLAASCSNSTNREMKQPVAAVLRAHSLADTERCLL